MRFGPGRQLDGDINVTPMIDVMLVLIVVFMLAMKLRMLMWVNVPGPVDADAGPAMPQVVLDLKADGGFALNGTVVVRADLSARLEELYRGTGRQTLFVRSAPHRKYREVIDAVDVARAAGVPIVGYMK